MSLLTRDSMMTCTTTTTIHPRVVIHSTIECPESMIHSLEDFLPTITSTKIQHILNKYIVFDQEPMKKFKNCNIIKDITPFLNFLHTLVHLLHTLVHLLHTLVHPLHTLVHPLHHQLLQVILIFLLILTLLPRTIDRSLPTTLSMLLQVILYMALSALRIQVLLLFLLIKELKEQLCTLLIANQQLNHT